MLLCIPREAGVSTRAYLHDPDGLDQEVTFDDGLCQAIGIVGRSGARNASSLLRVF